MKCVPPKRDFLNAGAPEVAGCVWGNGSTQAQTRAKESVDQTLISGSFLFGEVAGCHSLDLTDAIGKGPVGVILNSYGWDEILHLSERMKPL